MNDRLRHPVDDIVTRGPVSNQVYYASDAAHLNEALAYSFLAKHRFSLRGRNFERGNTGEQDGT